MPANIFDVLDAAYRMDVDEPVWLRELLDVSRHLLTTRPSASGYFFDAADGRSPSYDGLQAINDSVPIARMAALVEDLAGTADLFRRMHRGSLCSTTSAIFRRAGHATTFAAIRQELSSYGVDDILLVNAVDPSGIGVSIQSCLYTGARVDPRNRRRWSRLAAHICAGHRLRRRLGRASVLETADAIMSPSGVVAHASAAARPVRAALSAATKIRQRDLRRSIDLDQSLELSTSLVGAQWTLLHHVDHDGKQFVLAQRNEPKLDRLALLSPRELQAVAHAAEGHPNKLIAYELGLAVSTVGVLLMRARAKLQVQSRVELITRYRESILNQRRPG